MSDITVPTVELNNGILMPQLGFGVYQVEEGSDVEDAVKAALGAGYRAIDTAAYYGNEAGVGKAIKASGIPREELFVTTKLWNDDQGYDSTLKAFEDSMSKLNVDYLDLYLIHWPKPSESKYLDTWKAFEKLYEDGRIRAIGVSNFLPEHLDDLIGNSEIVPAVNQIELHPRFNQKETRDYCESKGIQVESWSPLMQGGDVLDHDVIQELADKYEKQAGQIVLRWHIQSGLVVIPKSVTPDRIKSNIDIFNFELNDEDMDKINQLNQDERIGPHPQEM